MMNSPAFIGCALAFAWFLVSVIVHILGWRAGFDNARWLLASYPLSLLGALASTIVWTAASATGLAIVLAVLIALLTSACLFVLYVPAVYTVLTSLSVQTLVLLRRRGGSVSEAELYDRFAGRAIVHERLAVLAESGYLARQGTGFGLTARGRAVAKTFALLKTFWGLGAGG